MADADVVAEAHGSYFDHNTILHETFWCYYCLCMGEGCGSVGDPLCGNESKTLCIKSVCMTADIAGGTADDGMCNKFSVCLCLTDHCQFPPMAGAPTLACCNKICAGGEDEVTRVIDGFDFPSVFKGTFWVYYCCCAGLGLSAPLADGRPLFQGASKVFCIRADTRLEAPFKDGALCSEVGTSCCIWSQCQIPPAEYSPICAVCNMRARKFDEPPAKAPSQMSMPSGKE